MTDLEMTYMCAKAMGFSPINVSRGKVTIGIWGPNDREPEIYIETYNPLHDDAQAMALVKKFVLLNDWHPKLKTWSIYTRVCGKDFEAISPDLNRAIVECVAKMQAAKNA